MTEMPGLLCPGQQGPAASVCAQLGKRQAVAQMEKGLCVLGLAVAVFKWLFLLFLLCSGGSLCVLRPQVTRNTPVAEQSRICSSAPSETYTLGTMGCVIGSGLALDWVLARSRAVLEQG